MSNGGLANYFAFGRFTFRFMLQLEVSTSRSEPQDTILVNIKIIK